MKWQSSVHNGWESAAENPCVRPDVWEVIEYAEKKHGMKVSLITSGFAWDEERFAKLRKYEVHTAISIDGTRDTNDLIRRKGGYDKALHAMKKLSEVGLLDCLVTTMTKFNIKEMAHIPRRWRRNIKPA